MDGAVANNFSLLLYPVYCSNNTNLQLRRSCFAFDLESKRMVRTEKERETFDEFQGEHRYCCIFVQEIRIITELTLCTSADQRMFNISALLHQLKVSVNSSFQLL